MNAIEVVVSDTERGVPLDTDLRHVLPVKIGRGSDAGVRLPSGEVSRVHVTVSERDGVLVLADTSANGTTHRGRLIHNAETTLENRDEFQIRQYHVAIKRVQVAVQPPVFHAVVRSGSLERTYAVGPTFLVLLLRGDRAVVEVVRPKDPASILAANAADGLETLAILTARDGAGLIVTTPAAKARRLLINRGECRTDAEQLRSLDVVSLGRLRIEILEQNRRALKCKNVECELLNPDEAHENCRFCGHRLVEAQTRVATG